MCKTCGADRGPLIRTQKRSRGPFWIFIDLYGCISVAQILPFLPLGDQALADELAASLSLQASSSTGTASAGAGPAAAAAAGGWSDDSYADSWNSDSYEGESAYEGGKFEGGGGSADAASGLANSSLYEANFLYEADVLYHDFVGALKQMSHSGQSAPV